MSNQPRSIAIQWTVSTIVMVFVIGIMLFNFSTKSRLNASEQVNQKIVTTAEMCSDEFRQEIDLLKSVGETVAAVLQSAPDLHSPYAVEMARIAKTYSDAYKVYLCNADGKGINSYGENVSIADSEYFETVRKVNNVKCVYANDDSLPGQGAIIVTIPVICDSESGYLLLFYQLDDFAVAVKNNHYGTWRFEMLMSSDGTIVALSGVEEDWEQGDNLYELLEKKDAEAARMMKGRIRNGINSQMPSVHINGEENTLVYTRVGVDDLTLVVGVEQRFMDYQVEYQWGQVRDMLSQLIIAVGIFICLVVVVNVISKLISSRKQKQLEEKADTDLLTGLNNKLATERKIKEYMERNPSTTGMMFVLDIDNFKKINDTMGHAFGDEVLRTLGGSIGSLFRASDILGRIGGDEFIIFLKDIANPQIVVKEAKKVENFFKDFKAGEYTKYAATASIGVAIFPDEGADFESLYKAADQALYKAKKRGKKQLAFYNDERAEGDPQKKEQETS